MWQIISTYIGIVIMTIGVYFFGKIILAESNQNNKNKILFILFLICIIHTIIYTYLDGTLKTVLVSIINMLFYKYTFNISTKKAIFLTFLYLIILIIPDLLELFFVTKILKLSIEECYNSFAGSIIGNISICILFLIITYLLRKPLKKLINTQIDNNIKIIIYSIIIFICVGMFFHTIIKEFKFGQNIFIYIIAIIVLLIVLFSLIKQTIENKKIINKYDKLLEFMTSYEKEIEKIRVLRHETKNEFLSIKSKIIDKQKEKDIIKYIDEILNEKHEFKNEIYAKFGYLPANGIKGLCYFKTQEAENKGLKTAINISTRVENSIIYKLNTKQNRDLGKILGVLLDNAIEGALETKEHQFSIEVYLNTKKDCIFIISNSHNQKIDFERIGIEKYSTKDINRGHGLLLVNHLINKNNIFILETKITKKLYIQTLTIKKSISKK
ncbi:MAG: GHKL domain-containing protein [Bacilli bacterium]|nr:GHKL domain-containing protein [Bacilli bacterium]